MRKHTVFWVFKILYPLPFILRENSEIYASPSFPSYWAPFELATHSVHQYPVTSASQICPESFSFPLSPLAEPKSKPPFPFA